VAKGEALSQVQKKKKWILKINQGGSYWVPVPRVEKEVFKGKGERSRKARRFVNCRSHSNL